MISSLDFKNIVLNKPTSLIPWVWIDSKLSANERQNVHFQMVSWLKKNTKKEIGAGIDAVNLRSLKFFTKLGFKPTYILFQRRNKNNP